MNTGVMYTVFGSLAAILSIVAFIPYVRAILKHKTRPSGASWWTWSILAGITVLSAHAAGAPWYVLILPLWLCVSELGVAVLSLTRGDNNWDTLNIVCVVGALVGIMCWLLTGQPLVALGISIVADFLGSVPNFRHVYRHPEQEDKLAWILGWGSAVLEIFAVKNWSIAESGWPIYFLINMSIVLFLLYHPKPKY